MRLTQYEKFVTRCMPETDAAELALETSCLKY